MLKMSASGKEKLQYTSLGRTISTPLLRTKYCKRPRTTIRRTSRDTGQCIARGVGMGEVQPRPAQSTKVYNHGCSRVVADYIKVVSSPLSLFLSRQILLDSRSVAQDAAPLPAVRGLVSTDDMHSRAKSAEHVRTLDRLC